jgi:anti-sigma factor (TIGR02949 family)
MSELKRIPRCSNLQKSIRLMRHLLDNQVTVDHQSFLIKHLNECAQCLEQYETELYIRSLLKTKLPNKPIPANLASEMRHKVYLHHIK